MATQPTKQNDKMSRITAKEQVQLIHKSSDDITYHSRARNILGKFEDHMCYDGADFTDINSYKRVIRVSVGFAMICKLSDWLKNLHHFSTNQK